jgi:hypothetical protein
VAKQISRQREAIGLLTGKSRSNALVIPEKLGCLLKNFLNFFAIIG